MGNAERMPGIGHNSAPDQDLKDRLQSLREGIEPILAALAEIVTEQALKMPATIKTAEDCKTAIGLAIWLRDTLAAADAVINGHRKPLQATSEAMVESGREWLALASALELEARNRIQAFLETLPDGMNVRTEHGALGRLQEGWKVEVTDPDLVPVALRSPDPAKLKAQVAAGAREIDGCRVYQTNTLHLRETGKV